MSSKSIKDKPDPEVAPGNWQPAREYAPSVEKADELSLGRLIGFCGLGALVLGGFALFLYQVGMASHINPFWASMLVMFGLVGLLFHASQDGDQQIRRVYMGLGYIWLVAGAAVTALPIGGPWGTQFLPWGFLFLALALAFMLMSVRHETDASWRRVAVLILGAGGVAFALFGFVRSNITTDYLLPYDMLLALLGLGYWWASVGLLGTNDDRGYRGGLAMGLLGVLVFVVALLRSALPSLLYSLGWSSHRPMDSYFASSGLVLMVLGLAYFCVSAGLVLDHRIAVLARRELSSFFYSPMAYIVLFGTLMLGLINVLLFANLLNETSGPGGSRLLEPIIQYFFFHIVPIFVVIFVIPVLTMRLFSEEKRSGTLEVMLTVPVDETAVVLGKFFAVLVLYLGLWVPWVLYLVGLRVIGGEPFDYRPAISFFFALVCSGAGLLALGIFFSSLTKNQIAAAILTFMVMVLLVGTYMLASDFIPRGSAWYTVLSYVNFLVLWRDALTGKLEVRQLVFWASTVVFWLFLTVKVLEARKWT